jgi:transposase
MGYSTTRELTALGYQGSPKAMYNYLATLRTSPGRGSQSSPSRPQKHQSIPSSSAPLENFSAQRATWLFVCHPDDLDERKQAELVLIRQASPSAEAAYRLAQAFMQMIREHAGHQLDPWLSEVKESSLPELKSFARGIQQDKAAVLAGLALPWSNGTLEGHVNRLKLIKRSMYGRAKLPRLAATRAQSGIASGCSLAGTRAKGGIGDGTTDGDREKH